jgi:MFS family permease
MKKKLYTSILLCNVVEHFDTALYAFLAPIFASLFFPVGDYVVQLIAAYVVIATSSLVKPIGTYFFSLLARKKGPLFSLKISIVGVSIATSALFFIPTYDEVGWIATALLILCRTFMGFFGAGEIAISRIFIIENNPSYRMSALYEASSIVGIILASGMTTIAFAFEKSQLWRFFFILSGAIGIMSFFLRISEKDEIRFRFKPQKIKINKLKVLKIASNIVVSNITYSIPFVLLNTLIPMVNPEISKGEMMSLNTLLLCIDLIAFFAVGSLNLKIQPKKIIFFTYGLLGLLSPLLFFLMEESTVFGITFIRGLIVVLGVIAVAAQNLYFNQLLQSHNEKYSIIGNSIAIGDALFGKATPAICLALFTYTGEMLSIGLYISFFCFVCIYLNSLD